MYPKKSVPVNDLPIYDQIGEELYKEVTSVFEKYSTRLKNSDLDFEVFNRQVYMVITYLFCGMLFKYPNKKDQNKFIKDFINQSKYICQEQKPIKKE